MVQKTTSFQCLPIPGKDSPGTVHAVPGESLNSVNDVHASHNCLQMLAYFSVCTKCLLWSIGVRCSIQMPINTVTGSIHDLYTN